MLHKVAIFSVDILMKEKKPVPAEKHELEFRHGMLEVALLERSDCQESDAKKTNNNYSKRWLAGSCKPAI